MSDSNTRFDPYTGDPIPNDTPDTQPNDNLINSTPDRTGMQPENVTEEPILSGFNEIKKETPVSNDTTYNFGADNMYHTNDTRYVPNNMQPNANMQGDSFNNNYQYQQENQQYNPYTGQPVNNGQVSQQEYNEKKDQNANIFSGVALGCGIASIIFSFASFCCCPFLSILLAIAGIIFGCLAKNSLDVRNGVAVAGIITSICGIVLTILLCIVCIAAVTSSDDFYEKFLDGYRSGVQSYDNDHYDNDYNDFQFNDYEDYDSDLYDYDNFY